MNHPVSPSPSTDAAHAADPAIQGPAPLPAGTDTDKARQQEAAALDNVRSDYDDRTRKAGRLSARPDGDTQGGPGANNDAAVVPAVPDGQRGQP